MIKNFRQFLCILTVLIVPVLMLPCLAGDNIPSDKEVIYAQQVYKQIKALETNESTFLTEFKACDISNNNQVKAVFTKKFNYTKNVYTAIMSVSPTSRFMPIHKKLLESLYGNLQYLQDVISRLSAGKKINELNKETSITFKKVSTDYSSAVNAFMQMIRSWQKPYHDKVEPPSTQPVQ